MIQTIDCRLAIYDPAHLQSSGGYWFVHDPRDPVAVLDELRMQFFATDVANTPLSEGTLLGGVVRSGPTLAVARILDGGRDERGRPGRRVLAFLLMDAQQAERCDLKHLFGSQAFKLVAEKVKTGGRIASQEGLDLRPQINTRPIATETEAMKVDSRGSFDAKADIALAQLSQLFAKNRKASQVSAGFVIQNGYCSGKTNLVKAPEPQWEQPPPPPPQPPPFDPKEPGIEILNYPTRDRSTTNQSPKPPLANPLVVVGIAGGALLFGLLVGVVLGLGGRSPQPPKITQMRDDVKPIEANGPFQTAFKLELKAASADTLVCVRATVKGGKVESGRFGNSPEAKPQPAGEEFEFQGPWPKGAQELMFVLKGTADSDQNKSLEVIASCYARPAKDARKKSTETSAYALLDIQDTARTNDAMKAARAKAANDVHIEFANLIKGGAKLEPATNGNGIEVTLAKGNSQHVKGLGKLREVTTLSAEIPGIKGQDLAFLKEFTGLKILKLTLSEWKKEDAVHLQGLHEIQTLRLSGGEQLGDGMMTEVGKLKKLKVLELPQAGITQEGLQELSDHKTLEVLDLSGCAGVKSDAWEALGKITKLTDLNLSQTAIEDINKSSIDKLKNLKTLNLSQTKVTDKGLESLKDHKSLDSLDLSETMITDTGLAHLHGLTNLKSLIMTKVPGVTDDGVAKLKENVKKVEVKR